MINKIFAIIGGTIALFGLGYLIYIVLGFDFQDVSKTDFPPIILMEVLYAIFLTIIFSRWAQIKTFSSGLTAGFVIGAFIGGCSILHVYATGDLTDVGRVVSAAITFGIRFAVAGGIIGWFLGRG